MSLQLLIFIQEDSPNIVARCVSWIKGLVRKDLQDLLVESDFTPQRQNKSIFSTSGTNGRSAPSLNTSTPAELLIENPLGFGRPKEEDAFDCDNVQERHTVLP